MGDDENSVSAIGYVLIFSFVSVVFIFLAMMLLGGFNNYALYDLISILDRYVNLGLVPTAFGPLGLETASSLSLVMFYLDYIWFGAFVSMIISGLIISYNRKRENYFNLLTMSTLGLVLFIYMGSFIIQLTEWFEVEILFSVFPTLSSYTVLFSWYLNHLGIINLVIICLHIIANFVDLDFVKFNKRKEGESLDEI